jgi:hypothetical protein
MYCPGIGDEVAVVRLLDKAFASLMLDMPTSGRRASMETRRDLGRGNE